MTHRTTLMFPERLWRLLQKAAREEGVSASEWIRSAVRGRLTYERALEGDEIALRMLRLTPEQIKEIDQAHT